MEVVEPIDEAAEVALEWPAGATAVKQINKHVEGVAFDQFANVDLVGSVNQRAQQLEEGAEIGQFWTHFHLSCALIAFLILSNEIIKLSIAHMCHDLRIRIILHDLEYLYLMRLERPAIAVNKIPKEIQQLRLVVALLRLTLDVLADLSDELKHC